jgi:hypothetical protein
VPNRAILNEVEILGVSSEQEADSLVCLRQTIEPQAGNGRLRKSSRTCRAGALVCLAKIKSTFELNNILGGRVTGYKNEI